MFETLLTSFTTFFATIGPIEAAVLFATLTPKVDHVERARIANRAVLIATIILVTALLLGQPLLNELGVTLPALQTSGGIILFIIALDMVFARPLSTYKLTPPEGHEAETKDDLAVFPLATPLLAGPGAMSGGILMAANAHNEPLKLALGLAALLLVMGVTLIALHVARELDRLIGVTAARVLMRVFGILLGAIAVQSVFNGIGASGLFRAG